MFAFTHASVFVVIVESIEVKIIIIFARDGSFDIENFTPKKEDDTPEALESFLYKLEF